MEGLLTVTPNERLAITGHYRWRDSQNDALSFSEWGRTSSSPGGDIWFAADDKWALTAGYVCQKEQLETLFSTLASSG